MVRAVDVGMYLGIGKFFAQAVGHEEVVDAPAGILLTRTEAVGPPRINVALVGVEVAEGIGKAALEQGGELVALFVGEARVTAVGRRRVSSY